MIKYSCVGNQRCPTGYYVNHKDKIIYWLYHVTGYIWLHIFIQVRSAYQRTTRDSVVFCHHQCFEGFSNTRWAFQGNRTCGISPTHTFRAMSIHSTQRKMILRSLSVTLMINSTFNLDFLSSKFETNDLSLSKYHRKWHIDAVPIMDSICNHDCVKLNPFSLYCSDVASRRSRPSTPVKRRNLASITMEIISQYNGGKCILCQTNNVKRC